MKKRIIILIFSIVCLCSSFQLSTEATELKEEDNQLDLLDQLIVAHMYMANSEEDKNCWPETVFVKESIPLYNLEGDVIAHYLHFKNGGYAVIHNSQENPSVIEYGEDENYVIQDILTHNTNPHIIYNSPFDLYEFEIVENSLTIQSYSNNDDNELYDEYPELLNENPQLSNGLKEQREEIVNQYPNLINYGKSSDYGFINWDSLPSGTYSGKSLSYSGINWAVCSTYQGKIYNNTIIKDHCAAICINNLAIYYGKNGYPKLLLDGHYTDMFYVIYGYTGNGGANTAVISSHAKSYFELCGYSLNSKTITQYSEMKQAINNGHPFAQLLLNININECSAHWILGLGYREYSSGNYLQIVDGWNNTAMRFYKIGTGSLSVYATEYWVN